jgi:hypothetical protein
MDTSMLGYMDSVKTFVFQKHAVLSESSGSDRGEY